MGPDGNLYISSQFSNAILEYNLGTHTLSTFISSTVLQPIANGIQSGLNFAPSGLRFGPEGNLYVSLNGGQQSNTGAVVCFNITSTGGVLSYTGTDAIVDSTGLVQPTGMTFGTTGDTTSLYVSSSGADTVVKIATATTTPTPSTFITGGPSTGNLNYPSSLVWGSDGKLYVVDLGASAGQHGQVLRFTASGSFDTTFVASGTGSNPGDLRFQFPSDAVFDTLGNLDTADLGPTYPPTLAGSINQYSSTGVYTTALVTSSQFSNTGSGTSGIAPSQLVFFAPPTTTMLTDNGPNPSTGGQAVGFTVTVSGDSTLSGETVTIEDASNGNAVVATPTLTNGTVTFNLSSLTAGTHNLFAVYAGDATHPGSTSSQVSQAVLIGTTTTLTDNGPNPSAINQPVSFTVTVSGGAAINAETVQIEDASNGNAVVATPTLTNSTASFTLSNLSVGTHNLFAVYTADSTHQGSQSTQVSQVVNNTLIVLTTQQTNSGIIINFNQPVNSSTLAEYAATVNASVASSATGGIAVAVTNGGAPVLGSLVLSNNNSTVYFVKTGTGTAGLLPAGTNTLSLLSGASGFQTPGGVALSGAYQTSYTVSSSTAPVVSVPDFARGPGEVGRRRVPLRQRPAADDHQRRRADERSRHRHLQPGRLQRDGLRRCHAAVGLLDQRPEHQQHDRVGQLHHFRRGRPGLRGRDPGQHPVHHPDQRRVRREGSAPVERVSEQRGHPGAGRRRGACRGLCRRRGRQRRLGDHLVAGGRDGPGRLGGSRRRQRPRRAAPTMRSPSSFRWTRRSSPSATRRALLPW